MQQIILKYKWIFLEIITVAVVVDDDVNQNLILLNDNT